MTMQSEQTNVKNQLTAALRYLWRALRPLALAVVLGVLCGALGALFHRAIDLATQLRGAHPWLLWLLPLGGLLVLGLYRLCRVSFDAGTNLIIESVSADADVPILLAPLIVAGTVVSHLLGASVGREGAALQLGGSIGQNLGQALRLGTRETRVAAQCGMAACFAAMFGTPLAAAVFVVEVIRVGRMGYHALLPCLCASMTAHLTALSLGAEPLRFTLSGVPALDWLGLAKAAGLGIGCALVSILLCLCLEEGGRLAKTYIKNPYLRIGLGGAVMALVTVGFGLYDYAGAGTQVIHQALAGEARPWSFLVKLALTALCVAAGFRGGEIVPTLFIGSTFGCVAGPLLRLDSGFAAACAMIAVFCSAVNCPMASLLLACELFGTQEVGLMAVTACTSFVLSGRFGLYASQTMGDKVPKEM